MSWEKQVFEQHLRDFKQIRELIEEGKYRQAIDGCSKLIHKIDKILDKLDVGKKESVNDVSYR